jgi:hypothetical protein
VIKDETWNWQLTNKCRDLEFVNYLFARSWS